LRQRSLQYLTSAHTFSHFFRHENGRPQTVQIFEGRFTLACAMLVGSVAEFIFNCYPKKSRFKS